MNISLFVSTMIVPQGSSANHFLESKLEAKKLLLKNPYTFSIDVYRFKFKKRVFSLLLKTGDIKYFSLI